MFHPMKPETVKRRAEDHKAEAIVRRAVMLARLERKVAEHGFESIWAELLAEAQQRA